MHVDVRNLLLTSVLQKDAFIVKIKEFILVQKNIIFDSINKCKLFKIKYLKVSNEHINSRRKVICLGGTRSREFWMKLIV